MSIPSSWVLDVKGLKWAMLIGGLGTLIGAWLRYIIVIIPHIDASMAYSITMLAQIIAALAQPFLLNAPTMFAATWFPVTSRNSVNAVATIANPFGVALGSLLVPNISSDAASFPLSVNISSCFH